MMMNSSVSKMFLERKTFKYQITEKMYTVLLITVLIYAYYIHITVLAVDDGHVAFCEYNGSVARITFVAVATLANEKLLERVSDNDLLLCRKSTSNKTRLDNDLIDV